MSDIWNHEADAFDDLCFDDQGRNNEYTGANYQSKTCRLCGTTGLSWVLSTGKYHLSEHNCFINIMKQLREANNARST